MMRTAVVFAGAPLTVTFACEFGASRAINRSVSELHHSRTGKVVVTKDALVLITVMNWTRR